MICILIALLTTKGWRKLRTTTATCTHTVRFKQTCNVLVTNRTEQSKTNRMDSATVTKYMNEFESYKSGKVSISDFYNKWLMVIKVVTGVNKVLTDPSDMHAVCLTCKIKCSQYV